MKEVNPTLGEIMAYCEENGFVLESTLEHPTVVGNIQMYGDVNAQTYFTFYNQNKAEIDNWIMNRRNNPVDKEVSGKTR